MILVCPGIDKNPQARTPHGLVSILGPVCSKRLIEFDFDENLNNFRPAERQKEALFNIAKQPEGMVYVALSGSTVIGYVTFHRPNKYSRWSKHPRILEVGTIEVAPKWRKFKIAHKLLELAFKNPLLESYILITIEFCWHWDLEQTNMNIWQYQRMLARLLGSVGMRKTPTDDQSILEHPANVLMVKFGNNISSEDLKLFSEIQFENNEKNNHLYKHG